MPEAPAAAWNPVAGFSDGPGRLLWLTLADPVSRTIPPFAKTTVAAGGSTTPAKRIYLAIQLMYTSKDPSAHHDVYFALVRDITLAAPSVWPLVESINNLILTGNMYKALKQAKKLVTYEEELLNHAKRRTSLRHGGEADRQSA